jgi:hypothetical protein
MKFLVGSGLRQVDVNYTRIRIVGIKIGSIRKLVEHCIVSSLCRRTRDELMYVAAVS